MHALETLENWLQQQGWGLAEWSRLTGGYAADLYQVRLQDAQGRLVHAIYKKMAPARHSEIFLYKHILGAVPLPVPKLLGILEEADDEKGLLLEYGGEVLKPIYTDSSLEEKKRILSAVISELAHLHTGSERKTKEWLSSGNIFTYPYDSSLVWACAALDELESLAAETDTLLTAGTVRELREIADAFYTRYQAWTAGRASLTHGDPHLENILVGPDGLRLIDWEWACVSIPQRDIAILLQDVLDTDLHLFAWEEYKGKLAAFGWEESGEPLFAKGFYASMVDNTLMMLGWEIKKFRNGYLSPQEIKEILRQKINWIREYYQLLVT